jgi:hypothetical protein
MAIPSSSLMVRTALSTVHEGALHGPNQVQRRHRRIQIGSQADALSDARIELRDLLTICGDRPAGSGWYPAAREFIHHVPEPLHS